MTPNRPLDQQPVLLDEVDVEDIDTRLEDSDWHRLDWGIEYVVAEGEWDTARLYGEAYDEIALVDSGDVTDPNVYDSFGDANSFRNQIVARAAHLGASVSPLIRSRRVVTIATEYVTER